MSKFSYFGITSQNLCNTYSCFAEVTTTVIPKTTSIETTTSATTTPPHTTAATTTVLPETTSIAGSGSGVESTTQQQSTTAETTISGYKCCLSINYTPLWRVGCNSFDVVCVSVYPSNSLGSTYWHTDLNFGMEVKWKDIYVNFVGQGRRSKNILQFFQ